jgi:hypothetical protein
MNYKEFLYKMSNEVLSGLEVPNFVRNVAKKRLDEYFSDSTNDLDLELVFQKIIKMIREVKYP